MPMQANNSDGFKFNLGEPKGDHIEHVMVLVHTIAEEQGFDSIGEWINSDTFEPDDLIEEHDAKYRRTKYKGKYYHNFEWRLRLEGKSQYKNDWVVGLVLVTERSRLATSPIEFFQFSARKFWGDGEWEDD